MNILSKFDPSLTVFGLDEAVLDITDYCQSVSETGISPDEVPNYIDLYIPIYLAKLDSTDVALIVFVIYLCNGY